jgi:hypothetical protein
MLNSLPVFLYYPQHSTMFPKFLIPRLGGPYHTLLAALNVCLVLNLGALVFSLLILTRGTREYSAPDPSFSSSPLLTHNSLSRR